MDAQPLILGRYRPLELLGSGGFGEVELAYDTRMQRRVAIKRMPMAVSGLRPEAPGLSEARTAAMLNHPAIVTVYDFDADADEAFLIMEYVDGATLSDVLDALGGPLDLDEAAAVFGPLFDAIAFAHENGVVHLDLKPENVLIARDGRVKVADFGVAALSSAVGFDAADSGTFGFMPIEQLEGGRVSERTDVWALGALAYEALADANPWLADNVDEAIERLEAETPLPSHYVRLSDGIDDAIATATETDAGNRFLTVADFADALMPELGDATVGAPSLAEVARDLSAEEDVEFDRAEERLGLWDRLGGVGMYVSRGLTAAAAGLVAAWALQSLGLSGVTQWAPAALVAFGTAFAPGIGLAFCVLGVAIGGAALGRWPDAALTVALGAGTWWFGRRDDAASVLVVFSAALAVIGAFAGSFGSLSLGALLMLVPLVAGFTLDVAPAAFASATALWVASAISTAMRPDSGFAIASPTVWIGMAVFAAAAAAASWPAGRATRPGGMFGMLLGGAVLAGGTVLQTLAERWLAGGSTAFGSATDWVVPLLPVLASSILMLVVAALGAPLRSEPDDLPPAQTEGST